MSAKTLFPKYTPRKTQETKIKSLLSSVRKDRRSRVILLYGKGGVGKSYLLRNLQSRIRYKRVLFLGPIDIDDSEFWSVTNLNRFISENISANDYFNDYKTFISQLSEYEQERIGHETVLAHLRRGDEVFLRCYHQFINDSGLTPVLIFDTLEAIRGTDTLVKLLLWVKRLPGTLFILAGRPVEKGFSDPVFEELKEDETLEITQISLESFDREESKAYLEASGIASTLTPEEKERLALMSKGHPLWLALSIYYLSQMGVPEEVENLDIDAANEPWPYQNGPLHDAFLRRLVIPYNEKEFWHEAVLRLGIVRRRINKTLWQRLMEDLALPQGVKDWDSAWEKLLSFPWIRPRANRNYVTLQDALAEELATRIIFPISNNDTLCLELWGKAITDYSLSVTEQQLALDKKRIEIDKKFANTSGKFTESLIEDVFAFDEQHLELFLTQTTCLHYQMLCDYKEGCNQFIVFFDQAKKTHQLRFTELLWAELQRFLPEGGAYDPLEDVIKSAVQQFQSWYQKNPEIQFELIKRFSKYLYEIGQADESEKQLDQLWKACKGKNEWEHEILILRGNARMRLPGRVKAAEGDFEGALDRTRRENASEILKSKEGQALSELGYYHRNTGDWTLAAQYYHDALRVTHHKDGEKIASIESQYAYIQALRGLYQNAHELADSAIEIRRLLKLLRETGMALSVKGEVCRYERDFYNAWLAYQEAEEIFTELDDWGWLGLVRQEMAICLYQASKTNRVLPGYPTTSGMKDKAREMIIGALDYCREYSRRSYPSALNRAGRIIGRGFNQYDAGLEYLEEGIIEAISVADGWFWFANLIEFAELCFLAWKTCGKELYLTKINERFQDIENIKGEYIFSDLRGRWEILQGQIKAEEAYQLANTSKKRRILAEALNHFRDGYPMIALGYVGSHGAIALGEEFKKLESVVYKLDSKIRDNWFEVLKTEWSTKSKDPTEALKIRQASSLLALLNKSWIRLQYRSEEKPDD